MQPAAQTQTRLITHSQPKRARPSRRLFWRRRARGRELLCHAQLTLAASSTQHWLIRFVTATYPCTQFFPWQIEDRRLMGALHHNTVRSLLSHSHVAKTALPSRKAVCSRPSRLTNPAKIRNNPKCVEKDQTPTSGGRLNLPHVPVPLHISLAVVPISQTREPLPCRTSQTAAADFLDLPWPSAIRATVAPRNLATSQNVFRRYCS